MLKDCGGVPELIGKNININLHIEFSLTPVAIEWVKTSLQYWKHGWTK